MTVARADAADFSQSWKLLQAHPPTAKSLRASASIARPTPNAGIKGLTTTLMPPRRAAQDLAWDAYNDPSVAYATDYTGNVLSKVRLIPAMLSPGRTPTMLDVALGEGYVTKAQIAIMQDVLAEFHSAFGDTSDLLGAMGKNLFLAGDCYAIGSGCQVQMINGIKCFTASSWDIRSVLEVQTGAQGLQLRDTMYEAGQNPNAGLRNLDSTELGVRVWSPHPGRRWEADSSVIHALDLVEQLRALRADVTATAMSRLNAGAWLLSQDVLGVYEQPRTSPGANPDEVPSLAADLLDVMADPIRNPSSAATVAPMVIPVPNAEGRPVADYSHAVSFARPYSELAVKLREEVTSSVAATLDLPSDVLLGSMSDSNHWQGWLTTEQAWRAHLEPRMRQIVSALTQGFYRSALRVAGIPEPVVQRAILWYDEKEAVSVPTERADLFKAFELDVISPEYLLQELGVDPALAPDAKTQLLARALRAAPLDAQTNQAILSKFAGIDLEVQYPERGGAITVDQADPTEGTQALPPGTTPVADNVGAPKTPAGTSPVIGPPPVDKGAGPAAPVKPVRASAAPHAVVSPLTTRLAGLEVGLRERVIAALDGEMRRVLRLYAGRVKNKIIERASAYPPDLVAAARTGDMGQVWKRAGVHLSSTRVSDPQASDFSKRVAEILAWVAAAQASAIHLAEVDTDAIDDPDGRYARLAHAQEAGRDRAARHVTEVLAALALALLRDPDAAAPAEGEHDAGVIVPAAVVTSFLALAGGDAATSVRNVEGAILSAGMIDALTAPWGTTVNPDGTTPVAMQVQGWQWSVGAPTRPFLPHQDLDGTFGDTPEADVFSKNPAEFPYGTTHWAAGDHVGCQCLLTPVLVYQKAAA